MDNKDDFFFFFDIYTPFITKFLTSVIYLTLSPSHPCVNRSWCFFSSPGLRVTLLEVMPHPGQAGISA